MRIDRHLSFAGAAAPRTLWSRASEPTSSRAAAWTAGSGRAVAVLLSRKQVVDLVNARVTQLDTFQPSTRQASPVQPPPLYSHRLCPRLCHASFGNMNRMPLIGITGRPHMSVSPLSPESRPADTSSQQSQSPEPRLVRSSTKDSLA